MYTVIKVINGRRYQYLQRSYRVGRKVRTESIYLGPLDGGRAVGKKRGGLLQKAGAFIKAQGPLFRAGPDEQEILKRNMEHEARKEASRQAGIDRLHDLYGLRMSATVPTAARAVVRSAPETTAAKENPSDDAEGKETAGPSSE